MVGEEGAGVTTAVWIVLGAAVWLALAVVLAVCIGRIIRQRDEQMPRRGKQIRRFDRSPQRRDQT
jgi:hypothetical protein